MNWNVVLESLMKAKEGLENLHCRLYYLQFRELPEDCPRRNDESCLACLARQKERGSFDEGCLFVGMEQVYRHLNYGWNCRRMSEVSIKNIGETQIEQPLPYCCERMPWAGEGSSSKWDA